MLPLVAALVAGCYTYTPIELTAAAPGMEVRARVTAGTAQQLAPSLRMSDARVLSGSVVEIPVDGLTLRVASAPAGAVEAPDGLFQLVFIKRGELLELESRRLDNGRTRLAVGAGVVGAVALAATMLRGHSSGESAVTEPPANFNLGALLGHVSRFGTAIGVGWVRGPRGRGAH